MLSTNLYLEMIVNRTRKQNDLIWGMHVLGPGSLQLCVRHYRTASKALTANLLYDYLLTPACLLCRGYRAFGYGVVCADDDTSFYFPFRRCECCMDEVLSASLRGKF